MFPVAALRLSLAEIAALWAEEIAPPRTATQVQWFLEKAFWRGEFRGDGPSRLDVLRILRWGPVPDSDPATWTEEECRPVFESVANFWPYESVPGVAVTAPTVLRDVGLSRVEFMAWITAKGYHRPAFWRPFPTDNGASTRTADDANRISGGSQLHGKALKRELDGWVEETWGQDLTKLPGRDVLLQLARAKFGNKVNQPMIRALRTKLAPERSKRGGAALHRQKSG